jgi:putative oxidoreductase
VGAETGQFISCIREKDFPYTGNMVCAILDAVDCRTAMAKWRRCRMKISQPIPPSLNRSFLLSARILMASLAVFGGLEKIFNYEAAVAFASSFGIPFPSQTMPLAILIELGCAGMLFSGRYCRFGAAVLAAWTFVLGVWFHRFWAVPAADWQMMIDSFFHHFVMVGGFLYVAVFGDGRAAEGD